MLAFATSLEASTKYLAGVIENPMLLFRSAVLVSCALVPFQPITSPGQLKLKAILFGDGAIPLERCELSLPLGPGQRHMVNLAFTEKAPERIQFDVLRPTGFCA